MKKVGWILFTLVCILVAKLIVDEISAKDTVETPIGYTEWSEFEALEVAVLSAHSELVNNTTRLGGFASAMLPAHASQAAPSSSTILLDFTNSAKLSDSDLKTIFCSGYIFLIVQATKISDTGIEVLPKQRLVGLNVCRTGVSDESVPYFNQMTHLKSLNIAQTKISDLGFENLNCQDIESLAVSGGLISDRGVWTLINAGRLRSLWLSGEGITDSSIAVIAKLQALEFLNLSGSGISHSGAEKLRKALPECFLIE